MKKNFLKTAMAAIFTTGIALASMTACNVERFTYEEAERYKAGSAKLTENVTELEIDWLLGNVNIAYGDVETVTFSETSEENLTVDMTMHYWLENSTLHIKYAKSGIKLTNKTQPAKDLTVLLPAALVLKELDLELVDANATLTDVNADEVEIENVAGKIDASFGSVREFSVSAVSGDANMRFATMPSKGEYENVHGDLTMYLPENNGFTIEADIFNGGFESEFDTVKSGNRYVYGNGASEYEFETVSGNVVLKKLS